MFQDFENFDRFDFPEGIVRVTGGRGGEALLIVGREKIALIDCGMAFCHNETIKNIENALIEAGNRILDYIFLTHTHYDHVGALPYIRERWPEAIVFGAQKAKDILKRPGAQKLIKELGEAAGRLYGYPNEEIIAEGMKVHEVLKEGDKVSLGESYIYTLETKGHTDCSLTFVLEPLGLMFASESTGVLERKEHMHSAILKSYKDCMESIEKCRAYRPKKVIAPHFGMIPDYYIDRFWELFVEDAQEQKALICGLYDENFSEGEILKAYEGKYWSKDREREQPFEAFAANAKGLIKVILEEFRPD